VISEAGNERILRTHNHEFDPLATTKGQDRIVVTRIESNILRQVGGTSITRRGEELRFLRRHR
jgi:hypothetical protein